MKTRNNWKPVVRSFFKIAIANGFVPLKVDNGGGNVSTPTAKEATGEATACDEASVYMKHPNGEKTSWFYLVLGNDPEETLADFSDNPETNAVFEAFASKWEGRKCPTVQVA